MSNFRVMEMTENLWCPIGPHTDLTMHVVSHGSIWYGLLLMRIFILGKTLHDEKEKDSRNVQYSCWDAMG